MEKCSHCKQMKDSSEFLKSLPHYCVACRKERNKKRWLLRDKDRTKEVMRVWRKNNLHRKRAYHHRDREQLQKRLFDLLGRQCKECGFSDMRALQIDHINGNGHAEKRIFKQNRLRYLRHIIKVNGEGYQVLCANCNWIKRVELKEHGHPALLPYHS